MIHENFVYLGVVIGLLGGLSYLVDTLKGKTKPNKVSWFVWALAPFISTWAMIQQGVGILVLSTFIAGFNPLLIFIASFLNKKAYWKITKLDLSCGALAVLGLVLWQTTNIPNLAIFFGIIADGMAAIPTIIKSYNNPETENPNIFLAGAVGSIITLLTIKIWNFEYYAFPVYLVGVCALIYILIKFNIGKRYSK